MAQIEVTGGEVEIVSIGEGPDLVLLHSLLIYRSAFDRVVPDLAQNRRVHLAALPGFDGSSPAGPAVERYADRIADALAILGLGVDSAVLGNGFGGFVAIALAARHGTRFGKLVRGVVSRLGQVRIRHHGREGRRRRDGSGRRNRGAPDLS